jgi:hypothetical protein
MPQVVGEYVDRLVNVEMLEEGYPRRDRTRLLYAAARAKQGAPLTYLAAKGLADNIRPGDYVILMSGTGPSPWLERGGNDGPTGVASLARAISFGLGGNPVYVGLERQLGPVIAAGTAAGISVMDREAVEVYRRRNTALALSFPMGKRKGHEKAMNILDDLNPKAVIAIENHGPNPLGVRHNAAGMGIDNDALPHDYLIVGEANKRGIFTIGIGDGGDEIGFGLINEEANEIYEQAFGVSCQCGCGGGQACAVETDVLISAAVSAWGAYGVAACMAYMLRDPYVLQDSDTERRMGEAMSAAGAVAAFFAATVPWIDGTSPAVQQAVVTMLQEIVNNALRKHSQSQWAASGDLIRGRT